jgi:hypothetical protein
VDFSSSANAKELASGLKHVRRQLLRHGVTAFCPTVVTSSPDTYRQALPVVGDAPPSISTFSCPPPSFHHLIQPLTPRRTAQASDRQCRRRGGARGPPRGPLYQPCEEGRARRTPHPGPLGRGSSARGVLRL